MLQQIFLCFIGLCAGAVIAAGTVGLLIGLSIIPRYAGITHTSDQMLLYEDVTLLGTVLGNIVYLYRFPLPLGPAFLLLYGGFSGIFLGGWILALAEVASIFPVLFRRIRLEQGIRMIILCVALGKLCGALLFYYRGWAFTAN